VPLAAIPVDEEADDDTSEDDDTLTDPGADVSALFADVGDGAEDGESISDQGADMGGLFTEGVEDRGVESEEAGSGGAEDEGIEEGAVEEEEDGPPSPRLLARQRRREVYLVEGRASVEALQARVPLLRAQLVGFLDELDDFERHFPP
jgi:hypothetical protein